LEIVVVPVGPTAVLLPFKVRVPPPVTVKPFDPVTIELIVDEIPEPRVTVGVLPTPSVKVLPVMV
jgi:hypothetical protein